MCSNTELLDSSLSSSSSSSDSDYELIPQRKQRCFQERIGMEYFTDEEFKIRFRLEKASVKFIAEIISDDLNSLHDMRGYPLSPVQQLMITLRYYASGCFQIVAGDLFGIHQTTAGKTVHQVSKALARLSNRYIQMPTTETEMSAAKTKFFVKGGIPGVIGCIDGTHIPIHSPGGENPELFRNRKGVFSINVQGVCDAEGRFINLVAR